MNRSRSDSILTIIIIMFIKLIVVNFTFINLIHFMSEPRARPIAVSLLSSLLSVLLLPTGSLFGATGWDQESEVVLISGRAPPIE